MRNGFPIWFVLFATLALAGCRRNDLVENELRARDVQYREAMEEMMRTDAVNQDLRRENEALRAGGNLTPEQAALFGVRRIVIGRGTAGVDNDRVPGDEALQVWIEPRDASDHTIKAPGSLQIAVIEINPQGEKCLLSTWDIDPDQLCRTWKQGLLSIGYMVELPWKTPPRVETIRIVARFTLPDGRAFETDKDIKVRLLPGAALRPNLPPAESPVFHPTSHSKKPALVPASNWTPMNAPSAIQQTGAAWKVEPLHDAIQLSRPFPVYATPSSGFYRPVIGEIKVED